jgi:hypothetical protein
LVKRGTKTIEKVADNERNFVRDITDLHPDDVPLIFKVILSDKMAGFVAENGELFPEAFKMYLRPGCFEIGIDQRHDLEV